MQDAIASFTVECAEGHAFVGLIADGAGSAPFGGEGASLVVRSLATTLRSHFRAGSSLPGAEKFHDWLDTARDRLSAVAVRRETTQRDFASTLVCVISTGATTAIAHVGDGGVVLRNKTEGDWFVPSWPDHGEYASTTSFVTDQPVANLRTALVSTPVDAIVVFSDGLERLSLNFATHKPHPGFFDGVIRPLLLTEHFGRDATLSRKLGDYLDSELINSRTDDDKSLVIAIQR